MLGLKLEVSLVSVWDDKEVGVYDNLEADEVIIASAFDLAGVGDI